MRAYSVSNKEEDLISLVVVVVVVVVVGVEVVVVEGIVVVPKKVVDRVSNHLFIVVCLELFESFNLPFGQ